MEDVKLDIIEKLRLQIDEDLSSAIELYKNKTICNDCIDTYITTILINTLNNFNNVVNRLK